MTTAIILSPWTGSGTEHDAYRPLLIDDYVTDSMSDVTAQPVENIIPATNLVALRVECDAATLAAIEADPLYMVLYDI